MRWRVGIFVLVWFLAAADFCAAQGVGRGGWHKFQGHASSVPKLIIRPHFTRSAAQISAPTVLRVPSQYPTIQSAIDAAFDGDTVLVSDGTYHENIRYRGKAITVGSLYLTDGDTSHIERTIIDGSGSTNPDSGSTVYFINGEDTTSVLCGLTITGGSGTLQQYGGDWYREGGGIYLALSGARLTRNIITCNRIRSHNSCGGGLGTYVNPPPILPFLILEENLFADNCVEGDGSPGISGCGGAGGDINNTSVRIVRNVFERDTVLGMDFAGAGSIGLCGSDGTFPTAYIEGNIFRSNVCQQNLNVYPSSAIGGGLGLQRTGDVTAVDNLFEGNALTALAGWAGGGGIYVDDDGVSGFGRKVIIRNRFLNNRVQTNSSERDATASGGGIFLYRTRATLRDNAVINNSSIGNGNSNGGGLTALETALTLESNTFTQNTAYVPGSWGGSGGGIFLMAPPQSGGEQIVANNILSGNRGTGGGGGIGVYNNSVSLVPLSIVNNTIVENSDTQEGGGVVFWNDLDVSFMNNIVWNNQTLGSWNQISSHSQHVYCYNNDIMGGWSSGSGTINVPPQFADGSYRLSDSSFCIGAGIDSIFRNGTWYRAPDRDIYGSIRPSPVHSHPDIGACENSLPISINAAALSTSPQVWDFHNVRPGTTSDTLSITVANRDAIPWEILSLSPLKPEFVFSPAPGLPLTIAPHSQVQLRLTFNPTTPGATLRDTLRITTNDRYYATKSVALTGRGSGAVQCAQPGVLYGISATSDLVSLYEINRSRGNVQFNSQFTPPPPPGMSALTIRPTDNTMYGAFSSDTATVLYRMSSADGDLERFGSIPLGQVTSMAFSPSDRLYLLTGSGKMYRVRSPLSDTVFVGWTGHAFSGLAFSPATRMLWASAGDTVFTVDTTSGSATIVGVNGYTGPGSSIAFSSLGSLYGVFAGWLVTVDKVWGTATEIGRPGIPGLIGITMSDIVVDVTEEGGEQVLALQLEQNYPNPFNPVTTIGFSLPERTHALLKVYDLLGREVALLVNEEKPAGMYSVQFDASRLSSGIYIYRLQAGSRVQSRKMTLMK